MIFRYGGMLLLSVDFIPVRLPSRYETTIGIGSFRGAVEVPYKVGLRVLGNKPWQSNAQGLGLSWQNIRLQRRLDALRRLVVANGRYLLISRAFTRLWVMFALRYGSDLECCVSQHAFAPRFLSSNLFSEGTDEIYVF